MKHASPSNSFALRLDECGTVASLAQGQLADTTIFESVT
jgi:hypothetical protein